MFTSLGCGGVAAVWQLESSDPCQYGCPVDAGEVVSQDREAGQGSVVHGNVTSVVGDGVRLVAGLEGGRIGRGGGDEREGGKGKMNTLPQLH